MYAFPVVGLIRKTMYRRGTIDKSAGLDFRTFPGAGWSVRSCLNIAYPPSTSRYGQVLYPYERHHYRLDYCRRPARMFERTLQDLIRGLRAHKASSKAQEDAFLLEAMGEIREELKGKDMALKAEGIIKTCYVRLTVSDCPGWEALGSWRESGEPRRWNVWFQADICS